MNCKNLNFSVGMLQTLVKMVQVETLELITCGDTGTALLVRRTLTSNETKFSSFGFIGKWFNFPDEICTVLTKMMSCHNNFEDI